MPNAEEGTVSVGKFTGVIIGVSENEFVPDNQQFGFPLRERVSIEEVLDFLDWKADEVLTSDYWD